MTSFLPCVNAHPTKHFPYLKSGELKGLSVKAKNKADFWLIFILLLCGSLALCALRFAGMVWVEHFGLVFSDGDGKTQASVEQEMRNKESQLVRTRHSYLRDCKLKVGVRVRVRVRVRIRVRVRVKVRQHGEGVLMAYTLGGMHRRTHHLFCMPLLALLCTPLLLVLLSTFQLVMSDASLNRLGKNPKKLPSA